MKRCSEKAKSSRKRETSTEAQRLRGIYRNLSSSWEKLQVVRDHLSSPREIAAATVLEEDLQGDFATRGRRHRVPFAGEIVV